MELEFAKTIKLEHDSLRRQYYRELALSVTALFLFLMLLIALGVFGGLTLFKPLFIPILWISAIIIYVISLIIIMPKRFKMLQKLLVLRFFEEAQALKLELIPNLRGGQNFDYNNLLSEAGITKKPRISILSRYEFNKRLIHVLYFAYTSEPYAIIHIPNKESPYYLQINNANFAPPYVYKDIKIEKVAFVSPYNLSYYATTGPTNIKVYLRKELESRYIEILKYRPGTYQYVATYTDEFLVINAFNGARPIRLGRVYDHAYYIERLQNLIMLQKLMTIMLEKGR